jgi:hypothetical protein
MTENQPSDSGVTADPPSSGLPYQGSAITLPDAQGITVTPEKVAPSATVTTTGGESSPPQRRYYDLWPRNELAMRQAVDSDISSLRTHFEDQIIATNAKLASSVDLIKAELDNVQIRLNGRMDLLDKDVENIRDKRKAQRDRRWDVVILLISIAAALAIGVIAEKWIFPLVRK